jgi:16S rRNA processing protein RimM
LKEVVLEMEGRRRPSDVEQIWNHAGRPVFKFAGIDSISDAEPWAGAEVLVPEAERALPEEGEYSHADLIGCSIVAGQLTVGVVKGVEEFGGPPLLKVEAQDGREILVPFARTICREIDVACKIIRVELPDGLLDL